MAKKEQVTQFSGGMNLDTNPLILNNQTLTDALNATFLTFNGNEMMLQNDMGNARVHNARLKPGFIPLGMKEHGGVVYIASHNPISGESELGSFPSPERNHGWDEESGKSITTVDIAEWFADSCVEDPEITFPSGSLIISGDKEYLVSMKDEKGKDLLLNPGDLFKIILSNESKSLIPYVNYMYNTKYDEYLLLLEEGAIKPINFGVTSRNQLGNLEDITKDLLDENRSLNSAINFSDKTTILDEKTQTGEDELDNYRKKVSEEGFNVYAGRNAGYLNFAISLNTLKGFSVVPSYLINYDKATDKNKYTLILKVYINKEYNSKYLKDNVTSKISNSGVISSDIWLVLEDTQISVSRTDGSSVTQKIYKTSDATYLEDIKTLLNKKNIEDIPESYTNQNLFSIITFPDLVSNTESEGDDILKWSVIPKSSLAYECHHTIKGSFDLKNIDANNKPFTIKTWNYITNYTSEGPLELNYGYYGTMDENLLNVAHTLKMYFYDIYTQRIWNHYFVLSNSGNNFSSGSIQFPYIKFGESTANWKSDDENIVPLIEEKYMNSNTTVMGADVFSNPDSVVSTGLSEISITNLNSTAETTPLVMSSLYLVRLDLEDRDGNIINTDYRFIWTVPFFDNRTDVDFKDLTIDMGTIDIANRLLELDTSDVKHTVESDFPPSLSIDPEQETTTYEATSIIGGQLKISVDIPNVDFLFGTLGGVKIDQLDLLANKEKLSLANTEIGKSLFDTAITVDSEINLESITSQAVPTKTTTDTYFSSLKNSEVFSFSGSYEEYISGSMRSNRTSYLWGAWDTGYANDTWTDLKLNNPYKITNSNKFLNISNQAKRIEVEHIRGSGNNYMTSDVKSVGGLLPYIVKTIPRTDANGLIYGGFYISDAGGGALRYNSFIRSGIDEDLIYKADDKTDAYNNKLRLNISLKNENIPLLVDSSVGLLGINNIINVNYTHDDVDLLFSEILVRRDGSLEYYIVNPDMFLSKVFNMSLLVYSNVTSKNLILKNSIDSLDTISTALNDSVNKKNIQLNMQLNSSRDFVVNIQNINSGSSPVGIYKNSIYAISGIKNISEYNEFLVFYENKLRTLNDCEETFRAKYPELNWGFFGLFSFLDSFIYSKYKGELEKALKRNSHYYLGDYMYVWTPFLLSWDGDRAVLSSKAFDLSFNSRRFDYVFSVSCGRNFERVLRNSTDNLLPGNYPYSKLPIHERDATFNQGMSFLPLPLVRPVNDNIQILT